MKKKAILLLAVLLVLAVPLAIPLMPVRAQSLQISHSFTAGLWDGSPYVEKSNGTWVYHDPADVYDNATVVTCPWEMSPSGYAPLIQYINFTIYPETGSTENYVVHNSSEIDPDTLEPIGPPGSSGDYSWNLSKSVTAASADVGFWFKLQFHMELTNTSTYDSANVTVYYSDTIPCTDPSVTVDPMDSSDSDNYVRGTFYIDWAVEPAFADWINVSVLLTNGTAIINQVYDWMTWPGYGSHIVQTIGDDVTDGAYTLSVIVVDNTTDDDNHGVSIVGNYTAILTVANNYYTLTDANVYFAMPLVSTESEDAVEGVVNILFEIVMGSLIDVEGLGSDVFADSSADGVTSWSNISWCNMTLISPNATTLIGPNASIAYLYSDYWLPSGLWYLDAVGFMSTIDTAEWPDGTWSVEYFVNDTSGHSLIVEGEVLADNTVPAVAITSPADGAEVTGEISIDFTITEVNPVSVSISIGGLPTDLVIGELNFTGGTNSFTFDTTTVGDGELAIEINVEDNNLLGSDSIAVTVVNTRNSANSFYSQGMILGLGVGIPIFLLIGYALGSALMRGKFK
ncbi:MAG: hypothetical protein ACFFBS_01955 [Promethearchaeota archaeon]